MVSTNGEGDPSSFPIHVQKGLYDQFRVGGWPTLYGADQRPVTADILESGWIYATVILAFSLLILLPGLRIVTGTSALIRILVGVGVAGMIMISNFGQNWETAYIANTTTAYRAGIPYEINASIGVYIGLRSVNITLKGIPRVQTFENGRINETIDYNERLGWDNHGWTQGRAGFGPAAGKYNRAFREHQRRGSPYPILWVAEYLTPDGEGLRWGRFYRNAGYFTHIMVWAALPLWILTVILFHLVISYGAWFSLMTGTSLFIANIIYATHRNSNQLAIPFPGAVLTFHWGWSFWMCMSMGLICCLIGIVVLIMNMVDPDLVSSFFNVDISNEYEEFYISVDEPEEKPRKSLFRKRTIILREAKPATDTTVDLSSSSRRKTYEVNQAANADEIMMHETNGYATEPPPPQLPVRMGFRKRTLLGQMQRSRKSQPRPEPPPTIEDYETPGVSDDYVEYA